MTELSEETLIEWIEAKRNALDRIAEAESEARKLSDKIEAFMVLFGDGLDEQTARLARAVAKADNPSDLRMLKAREEKAAPTLIEGILKVVNRSSEALTLSEVREQLNALGYAELNSASGYFYTAVKRLVERGAILRDGEKLSAARDEGFK